MFFEARIATSNKDLKTGLTAEICDVADRVDRVDTKVDRLDTKMDRLDTKVDARADRLDRKIDKVLEKQYSMKGRW